MHPPSANDFDPFNDEDSNRSSNPHFDTIMASRLSRRLSLIHI